MAASKGAPLSYFALGARGVNNSVDPIKLTPEELVSGQNVEVVVDKGVGSLQQRSGMTRVNSSALASLVGVMDVKPTFRVERTPWLYAATTQSTGITWRRSSDGAVWSNFFPLNGQYACAGFVYAAPYKAWPKAVAIENKLYFIGQVNTGSTDPLPLKVIDGTTEQLVSYVPPAVIGTVLATPNAPSAVVSGGAVAGSTTYTYKVVARFASSNSLPSAAVSNLVGNAVLSTTNYNLFYMSDTPVAGATSYDVYRTVGGATQGKIGSIPIINGAYAVVFTSGGINYQFSDTGLAGDGSAVPVAASGSAAANALAILDMITDGTFLYLATYDYNATDPTLYGRILQFDPASSLWTQIGAAFPTASGNGCPSTLVFFDGALSFSTYFGTAAANTSYLTTTGTPLPAGGISDVKTTAASLQAVSLAVFNGELYAGCASQVAGTAAIILKRAALATWSTVLTAGATGIQNAYNSLYVYGGRLYAGWNSGSGGATAALITSTADGSTWTTEITLGAQDMPCQFATFNDELYVVMGQTQNSTLSRILKRTAGGVWSEVDNPTDALSGALTVLWV